MRRLIGLAVVAVAGCTGQPAPVPQPEPASYEITIIRSEMTPERQRILDEINQQESDRIHGVKNPKADPADWI